MSEETILDAAPAADPVEETSSEPASQPAEQSGSYKDYFTDDGKIDNSFADRYIQFDPTADPKALGNLLNSNKNDVNLLVKQALNLNKMLGKEKIPLPGDGAEASEWDTIFERLGAPSGEDGDYAFDEKDVEGIPADAVDNLKSFLKEAKVPQRLAERIVPKLGQMMAQSSEAEQQNVEQQKREATSTLEEAWGMRSGTPEFSQGLQTAMNGLKIFAADQKVDDVQALTAKYGNDPFLLQVFAAKAKEGGEGGNPAGTDGSSFNTASGLDDRIKEAERVYFKSKSQGDMDKLMDLRERKRRLSP